MNGKQKSSLDWRDRITEFKRMRISEISGHKRNPKRHPKNQADAMTGLLNEVGKADVLKAYYNAEGKLTLWDGHLRQGLDPNQEWWIAITDLNDDEANKMLVMFDPIAAMAEYESQQLDSLLRDVNSGDEALQAMLAGLAEGVTMPTDGDWAGGVGGLPNSDRAPFQQMTFTLHDEQVEQVKRALAVAGKLGDFTDSLNQNSNGNALAFICELFVTDHEC